MGIFSKGGFLSKLIGGVGNLATGGLLGTGLEILGGIGKGASTGKPQQMQSQLTPEQMRILAARYKQLQAKAADTTGLDYVKKAGSIYDRSMGM